MSNAQNPENIVAHEAAVNTFKALPLPGSSTALGEITSWQVHLRDFNSGKILQVVKAPQVQGQSGFTFNVHEKEKTEKQANWILGSGVYRGLVMSLKVEDLDKTIKDLVPLIKASKKVTALYSFQIAIADGDIPTNVPAGHAYIVWDAADRFEIPGYVHKNTVSFLRSILGKHGISVSERRGFPKGRVGAAIVDLDAVELEGGDPNAEFDAYVGQ